MPGLSPGKRPPGPELSSTWAEQTDRVGCPSLRMRVSKRRLAVYLSLLVVFLTFLIASRKYLWLYATRKLAPAPANADLLRDPRSSQNPEVLLAEANRLVWVFNWPKAQPFYIRAEELFREKGDARNEVYARVGRIRAQSETTAWTDVSKMLGQALLSDSPINGERGFPP
jgi:hypothetical protein